MRPQRKLLSEMFLALSLVLRAFRSHPAALTAQSENKNCRNSFPLLLAICSLSSWKSMVWSKPENEHVIWPEELVLPLDPLYLRLVPVELLALCKMR